MLAVGRADGCRERGRAAAAMCDPLRREPSPTPRVAVPYERVGQTGTSVSWRRAQQLRVCCSLTQHAATLSTDAWNRHTPPPLHNACGAQTRHGTLLSPAPHVGPATHSTPPPSPTASTTTATVAPAACTAGAGLPCASIAPTFTHHHSRQQRPTRGSTGSRCTARRPHALARRTGLRRPRGWDRWWQPRRSAMRCGLGAG
jgi:hypothetical protein